MSVGFCTLQPGTRSAHMAELLRKVGTPAPTIIGVDEISIRKGHTYRIVVSDLERKRPIWFGGKDRSTERMDAFHEWLGPTKNRKIKFAVMDMWKPFASSLKKEGHAPQAAILFDKFHVMRHLGGGIGQSQEVGIPQPSADGGSR